MLFRTVSLIATVAIWISDSASNDGFLNMTPGEREQYALDRPTQDSLEREKLLSTESTSDLSADDLLQPQSDIRIRNRYLSRIGAAVSHLYHLPFQIFGSRTARSSNLR